MFASDLKRTAFWGGLFIFTAFFFMVFEPVFGVFGVYDSQRLVQLFFLIVFFVVFASSAWPDGAAGDFVFLFFLAGLIACFLAVKPFWAVLEWGRLFLLFMLSFALARWREESLKFVVISFHSVTVLLCMKLLVGLFVISVFGGGIEVLAAGFSNHRHFTEYFIAATMFLAISLLSEKKLWLLSVFPFLLGWIVLFLSSGRASLLAFLASFVFYLLLERDRSCRAGFVFSLTALIGWFTSIAINFLDPAMMSAGRMLREGSSGRLELWLLALDLWLENLLFGVGPMHFAFYSMEIASHPHNLIIQLLAEWGAISLVSILTFFLVIFGRLYKSRCLLDSKIKASFSVLVGLLVSSMFGGVFVVPAVELVFFMMLGVVMSSRVFTWRSLAGLNIAVRVFTLGFVFLVLVAWLWRSVDVQRGSVLDAPRFWQNGGIPNG